MSVSIFRSRFSCNKVIASLERMSGVWPGYQINRLIRKTGVNHHLHHDRAGCIYALGCLQISPRSIRAYRHPKCALGYLAVPKHSIAALQTIPISIPSVPLLIRRNLRTPGISPDLESCIRTLIVSRGWQTSCQFPRSMSSCRTYATRKCAHRLHTAGDTTSGDVCGKAYRFLVRSRHGLNEYDMNSSLCCRGWQVSQI